MRALLGNADSSPVLPVRLSSLEFTSRLSPVNSARGGTMPSMYDVIKELSYMSVNGPSRSPPRLEHAISLQKLDSPDLVSQHAYSARHRSCFALALPGSFDATQS